MTKRRFLPGLAVAATLLGGGSFAAAQQPVPGAPTTVQLPTFSFFTVQTTVSVPDRGRMSLGGITRGRDGSIARGFGPLQNRAFASDRGASGATVHASIIDFEEIDRMLLAAAARRSGKPLDPAAGIAADLTKHVERAAVAGVPLPGSVAAIRANNAAAAEARAGEVVELLAKAQQAEADGKPAVAKIFYQMVIRRDAGQLKQQAQARLTALSEPTVAQHR